MVRINLLDMNMALWATHADRHVIVNCVFVGWITLPEVAFDSRWVVYAILNIDTKEK